MNHLSVLHYFLFGSGFSTMRSKVSKGTLEISKTKEGGGVGDEESWITSNDKSQYRILVAICSWTTK